MALRSNPDRYGAVVITIHWLTAIAVVAMLATGLAASNSADPGAELALLRVHAIMGVLVGVLTLLRIAWWLLVDTPPREAAPSRAQAIAARVVHFGLYAAILVMVASGIATMLMTGAGAQLAGEAPLPLPDFTLAPPFTVHGVLSRLLILLVIGHVGAALWHQFVRRDRLLARMGLGRVRVSGEQS